MEDVSGLEDKKQARVRSKRRRRVGGLGGGCKQQPLYKSVSLFFFKTSSPMKSNVVVIIENSHMSDAPKTYINH